MVLETYRVFLATSCIMGGIMVNKFYTPLVDLRSRDQKHFLSKFYFCVFFLAQMVFVDKSVVIDSLYAIFRGTEGTNFRTFRKQKTLRKKYFFSKNTQKLSHVLIKYR